MRLRAALAVLVLAQCGAPEPATRAASFDGPVCGSSAIRGVALPSIRSRVRGCGLSRPVRVSEIEGVRLVPSATISCNTAKSLATWVRRTAKPDLRRQGGGLAALRVFDSYSCRPRNNRPGAKVSVHGKGQAIDIGEFRLKDGSTLSVLGDWGKGRRGRILRALEAGACGPFNTVLGPRYNGAHRNHFHFDLEQNGKFCV